MSDLSDLHGIFPTSVRWNAEQGFLSAAIYDPTTGGRELQPFEFGQESTFAMDLATRMRHIAAPDRRPEPKTIRRNPFRADDIAASNGRGDAAIRRRGCALEA